MRDCTPALALVLASGSVPLWSADLFTFTLQDGITVYRWTSWDSDLTWSGNAFSSRKPWLSRGKFNVVNTMEIPTIDITLRALNDSFAGGADVKAQITNGLFDGASVLVERAFMTTPNDTATLGTILIFGGEVSTAEVIGNKATIKVKGKNNKLAMNAPRNVYQVGCIHAFCDAGCTLNRATFTTSYSVGTSPTRAFIPWAGSPPGNATNYRLGSIRMTSGPSSGQWRTVQAADATGLTLAYPLYSQPAPGDTFDAFEGCDKSLDSGSGQSCTDRANQQNWRAFPFVPPAETAF